MSKPTTSTSTNAGSFFSSSAWTRMFSRRTRSPGLSARSAAFTSGPTESGRSGTSRPSSSLSRFATGASESFGSRRVGRPRCETRPIAAPPFSSARMVGSAARMRVSSATLSPSSGTLKSTRASTRFPRGSTSSIVRLRKVTPRLAAGGDRLAQLGCDERGDVGEAAGVAPLVVVPGDDLHHIAEHDRVDAAHDRRVLVTLEIARDERLLGVIHDPLERPLRSALERGVHLLLRDITLEHRREVDDRDGRRRDAEGHPGEAALELRDDERDGARRAGLRRHDVLRRRARVAGIRRDGIEESLREGLRVDRREEPLVDAELVVEHFRDGREPVRRARGVRDDVVLFRVELLLVDAQDDGLVLVLRRSGDDDVLRTRVEVGLGLRGVGKETRRLDDDVDSQVLPGELRRIALRQDLDPATIDDEAVRGCRDLARILPVVRVVLEKVGVHLRIGEVVQRNDLDLGVTFDQGFQELPSDTTETVDGDLRHGYASPAARIGLKTNPALAEPLVATGEPLPCIDDCTQHADIAAQRGWHHADRRGRDLERARRDRAAHLFDRVGRFMLRDRSPDHDERRADGVRKANCKIAERLLSAGDDQLRTRVVRRGRGEHLRRVVDAERLGDESPGRERLNAAVAAASAARAFERHRDVTDLPRRIGRTAQEAAVADDRAADARRDRDVDEVAYAPRGAGDRLAHGGHHRVAIEVDRIELECARETPPERELDEANDVRRFVHDPVPVVEWSWCRASDAGEIARRRVDRRERGPRALCDRLDDVIRSGTWRRPLVARDEPRDGRVCARDDASDVRCAEIDAEEEAQTLGSLPARSGDSALPLPNTCCCAALYPFFALSLPNARSASS